MKTRITFLIMVMCGLFAARPAAADVGPDAIRSALEARITMMQNQKRFVCSSELICGVSDLPLFYRRNRFQPVWLDGQRAHPRVTDLLAAIRSSRSNGLNPGDYHLAAIKATLREMKGKSGIRTFREIETLVDLELLSTDAYLLLGSHLLAGRVNPETLYAKWLVDDPEANFAAILQKAVDADGIEASLRKLLPPHTGYTALKKQLAQYRRLSSKYEWPPIPTGKLIRKGGRDPRIPAIRRRLQLLGDLPVASVSSSKRFDRFLARAVVRFQRRHGLKPDGILGDRTLAALNVTPRRRIGQIKLNLERWRWIPRDLGKRHLLVNIADYSLIAVDSGMPVMRMRVVVGQSYRRTPVFSDTLTKIEINPYWNVPTRLAVDDLLPEIQKDPDYLTRNGFSVYAGWKKGARELDPAAVDWSRVTPENFWYRLRQNPGPNNTLGRMKFLFPNRFAVYLHDTPSRELFTHTRRNFSAGCIRVSRPVDLAGYLLDGNKGWNRVKILEAVNRGRRVVVRLKGDVDIHILYWTAWVDRKGILQFREDIYSRDRPLAVALNQRPPRLAAAGNGTKRN